MHKLQFNILVIAVAGAIQPCAASETILALDVTESLVSGMAVTHSGAPCRAPDWVNNSDTTKKGAKMKIDLTSREVPTPGEQPGVFADVVESTKTDKRGKVFKYLVLVGELAATKSSGKRFTAITGYNLDDTRGIERLKADLKVWRGSNTIPDLSTFDPQSEFLGKGFLAEPTVLDKGGKRQIQFSGFKRYAGDNPIAVSADFVRANPPTK